MSCLVQRKQKHRLGTQRRNVFFQRGNSVHNSLREGIGEEVQFLTCTTKGRMKQRSPLPCGCSEHTVATCFDPQCFHFQQLCSIPAPTSPGACPLLTIQSHSSYVSTSNQICWLTRSRNPNCPGTAWLFPKRSGFPLRLLLLLTMLLSEKPPSGWNTVCIPSAR